MTGAPPSPSELAAALAGRVIHDIAGQASGLIAAFDLIADPGSASMHDEALVLAEQSARKLAGMLALQRTVMTGAEPLSPASVERMAHDLFAGSRPILSLAAIHGEADPLSARVFLGLLQIAQSCAAAGGQVDAALVEGPENHISISAEGPRVRPREEELRGLSGRDRGAGQAHRWAFAYWLWSLVSGSGGTLSVEAGEGSLVIEVRIPRR